MEFAVSGRYLMLFTVRGYVQHKVFDVTAGV